MDLKKFKSILKTIFFIFIEILLVLIAIFILIFVADLSMNYIISRKPIVQVTGLVDTWIQVNGSIVGGVIGGIITGFVAFRVANFQIKRERKSIIEQRNQQLKIEVTLDVYTRLLNVNITILQNLYYEQKYLRTLLRQLIIYNKNYDKYIASDILLKKFIDFFDKNFNELIEKTNEINETNLKYSQLFTGYSIVLFSLIPDMERISNIMPKMSKLRHPIRKNLNLVKEMYLEGNKISDVEVQNILNFFNEMFHYYGNDLNNKILDLNVDIQNSMFPFFDQKILKNDHVDLFGKMLFSLDNAT